MMSDLLVAVVFQADTPVFQNTPSRRPRPPPSVAQFEARRTDVPSTSNTASKPFEPVANDVNKPCLGPRERRDPAAGARRIVEIDVELSQPSVER